MYVCLCRTVTDSCLRNLGADGVTSEEGIIAALGLDHDECCGFCMDHIDQLTAIAEVGAVEIARERATMAASTAAKE